MLSTEIFQEIKRAVNALPTRCRLIFKLVKEDGLKYKEVADLLDISIKTVEAQMAIALRRLGKSIKIKTAEPVKNSSYKKVKST
jgi:RNA polymerase sigma-70 factor (ECF subfamily)